MVWRTCAKNWGASDPVSLEFHLTHYERYRKEGLVAHRRGDFPRARFCLLKSSEHLYQVGPVPDEPRPATAFSTNGISEILALDRSLASVSGT